MFPAFCCCYNEDQRTEDYSIDIRLRENGIVILVGNNYFFIILIFNCIGLNSLLNLVTNLQLGLYWSEERVLFEDGCPKGRFHFSHLVYLTCFSSSLL